MKVYLLGKSVPVVKTTSIGFFNNIPMGRLKYSKDHIIALLAHDQYSQSGMAFLDMPGAEDYITAHRNISHQAPLSCSISQKPDKKPFIYEIEVDEIKLGALQEQITQDESNPGQEILHQFYKLDGETIKSALITTATLDGIQYGINTSVDKTVLPDFTTFKDAYFIKYNTPLIPKNRNSTMKLLLDNDQIKNMLEVYEHATENPNSRTAIVLGLRK